MPALVSGCWTPQSLCTVPEACNWGRLPTPRQLEQQAREAEWRRGRFHDPRLDVMYTDGTIPLDARWVCTRYGDPEPIVIDAVDLRTAVADCDRRGAGLCQCERAR